MMGRHVPEVGTVRRICNGTARFGDIRVIGAMDMVVVAALIGILLERPIMACSTAGSDFGCIVVRLLIVLIGRCLAMAVAKCAVDEVPANARCGNLDRMELIVNMTLKYTHLHDMIYVHLKTTKCRSLPHKANLTNLKAKLQTPKQATFPYSNRT